MDKIKDYIQKSLPLLEHNRTSDTFDLEDKTSKLLVVVANLTSFVYDLESTLTEARAIEKALYSDISKKAPDDKYQSIKRFVETNPQYIEAQQFCAETENSLSYLSSMKEVFLNGHIMFRQFSRSQ
jgi:hypothetical protein